MFEVLGILTLIAYVIIDRYSVYSSNDSLFSCSCKCSCKGEHDQ